jgi:hypothetical protein
LVLARYFAMPHTCGVVDDAVAKSDATLVAGFSTPTSLKEQLGA